MGFRTLRFVFLIYMSLTAARCGDISNLRQSFTCAWLVEFGTFTGYPNYVALKKNGFHYRSYITIMGRVFGCCMGLGDLLTSMAPKCTLLRKDLLPHIVVWISKIPKISRNAKNPRGGQKQPIALLFGRAISYIFPLFRRSIGISAYLRYHFIIIRSTVC